MLFLAACTADSVDTAPKPDDSGTTASDDSADSAGADTDESPPPGWYLDCGSGDDTADGRSPETALATLAALARVALSPGDAVYLRAGTTCTGTLRLEGTGTPDSPIGVGPWGDGAAPVIDAAGAAAAAELVDQGWIDLGGLELTGSTTYGVHLVADALDVDGVTLHDLDVHDVWGGAATTKLSGLVVAEVTDSVATFSGLEIDGVDAHDTDQWAGIVVYAHAWGTDGPRGQGTTVTRSTVHDVGGDGIVVFGADDAELSADLAWEVGQTPTDDVGTPNGIWTWDCVRCTVAFNEVHHVHSPAGDGGAFDVDWANRDGVVEYNYGHDNDGYCVAIFAAEGEVTSGAVVRYNVCADNGQAEDDAYEGDLFVYTWDGGVLGAVAVYGNTVLRRSPWGWPAVVAWSAPGEGSRIADNLFVVSGGWMATVAPGVLLDHNLWYAPDAPEHAWFDDGADAWADGLDAWEADGRETDSLWADPAFAGGTGKDEAKLGSGSPAVDAGVTLPDDGGCDGFGGVLDGARDIGAHELGASASAVCAGP